MRRRTALAAATAATVSAGAVLAAGGGAQAPGARTFTLIERFDPRSFGHADTPPRARNRRTPTFSVGDGIFFVNPVTNAAGERVGEMHGSGFATRRGRFERASWQARKVFVLRDGTISATAVVTPTRPAAGLAWAVDGGTGAYEGARGSIVNRPLGDGSDENTVRLLP